MQSRGKINAFFEEFPFLVRIIKTKEVREVKVSRVNLDLIRSREVFYLFDRQGLLIEKIRKWGDETLENAIRRHRETYYIVQKRVYDSSYRGYRWIDWLINFFVQYIMYDITVFKTPVNPISTMDQWIKEEHERHRKEVVLNIKQA